MWVKIVGNYGLNIYTFFIMLLKYIPFDKQNFSSGISCTRGPKNKSLT